MQPDSPPPPSSPATQDALRLNAQALQAIANRRPAEARTLLRSALTLDSLLLPVWLNLAVAQRMEGDFAGALETVDDALRIDPMAFRALLMKASLLEGAGKYRLAALSYENALKIRPEIDRLDEVTRRAVAHGREFLARHFAELDTFLAGHVSGRSTLPEAQRMTGFRDYLTGRRERPIPGPTHYYYPGLSSIAFHERGAFPWLEEVEAASGAIRAELEAVLDDEVAASDLEPYMQRSDTEPLEQWTELNKSLKWSAYPFAIYGHDFTEHRRRCPETAALLDRMPQPKIQNRCPASLFSILEPNTHIPAHNGVANFRLLCHVPLILPGNCRFRVGTSQREWKMGEAFVFDDTIEHEAWNSSDQRRAVMIFDIWHPDLSTDEQHYITETLTAYDAFTAQG